MSGWCSRRGVIANAYGPPSGPANAADDLAAAAAILARLTIGSPSAVAGGTNILAGARRSRRGLVAGIGGSGRISLRHCRCPPHLDTQRWPHWVVVPPRGWRGGQACDDQLEQPDRLPGVLTGRRSPHIRADECAGAGIVEGMTSVVQNLARHTRPLLGSL
jgi:hypothetical protein